MAGSFGAASIAAGAYLSWDADGALLLLTKGLGHFAPFGAAIPGVLVLLGTAILGVALIRHQKQ